MIAGQECPPYCEKQIGRALTPYRVTSVALVIAGQRLKQYRSYIYCLVMLAIECTFMPVGTVLGMFTITVLMRPA